MVGAVSPVDRATPAPADPEKTGMNNFFNNIIIITYQKMSMMYDECEPMLIFINYVLHRN